MGPSGSGKSTLMHCLAGLDDATSGAVVHRRHRPVDPRRQAADPAAPRQPSASSSRPSTWCRPSPRSRTSRCRWTSPAASRTRSGSTRVIDTVGLRDRLTTGPASCPAASSSGSPCARALAGRPEVVFADEPTGNLDSRAGAEMLTFLQKSVREMGQTIVMVTHDPAAAAYADRVRVPRRRPHRRRDHGAHRRVGPRPDEELRRPCPAGELTRCCASPSRACSHASSGCVLTALSVVLGVAFVAGTLILGDTMNSTFDKLFATAYSGTDVGVRGKSAFDINVTDGGDPAQTRPPVPAAVLEHGARRPGCPGGRGRPRRLRPDRDPRRQGRRDQRRAHHRRRLAGRRAR